MKSNNTEQRAFPILTDEEIEVVKSHFELCKFSKGEYLIRQGTKRIPLFVISSGEVRIVEEVGDDETFIAKHTRGHFTGDVDVLTERSSVFSAIASEPVEAFCVDSAKLRWLLNNCPGLAQKFVDAFLLRRSLLEHSEFQGVLLIGEANDSSVVRIREFFYKNHVPYTFYDKDSESGRRELAQLGASNAELPFVYCNGNAVEAPSLLHLSDCIGISQNVNEQLFDLAIIGSGPSGLAAAVYASSEGISTLVIDSVGPGGQAGSSSNIENFIGFPNGISGGDLANRGYLQALKFGAKFIAPVTVEAINTGSDGEHRLILNTGEVARARCVLIACGVTYRRLEIPGFKKLEGSGIYYAATTVESRVCEDSIAIVVGGGNSAGQAAMFLANVAKSVKLLIRSKSLSSKMSAYLSERVLKHPCIEVLSSTEVVRILGQNHIQSVDVRNNQTGKTDSIDCAAMFTFIGAQPNSKWLPDGIALDERGFVFAGASIPSDTLERNWPLDRTPCELETSIPGIMVAGDIRSGTTKRCGFAVGDGSLAVSCVHRYLSEL